MGRTSREQIEVVCFLDDDTVLEVDYFEEILKLIKYIQMH
jgi:GT2 family glycosyltransferase